MGYELMPLKIPGNWAVMINHFADADRIVKNGKISNYLHYSEDILWIESMFSTSPEWTTDPEGYSIALGWYPDSDPSGHYRLTLLRKPSVYVVYVESKNRFIIQKAIESCMILVNNGCDEQQIRNALCMHLSQHCKLEPDESILEVEEIKTKKFSVTKPK